jgi:hypothetical protein
VTFRFIALLAAAFLCSGCVFGDPGRAFDRSQDMVPGDLAHFRAKAAGDGGSIVDHTVAFPVFFLPLVLSVEEAEADRIAADTYNYHFEETYALGLVLGYRNEVAKFDEKGRNLTWHESRRLLLGLLTSSERNTRRLDDGSRLETSSYRFLTGIYGVQREGRKSRHRLLWFFTFGDELD